MSKILKLFDPLRVPARYYKRVGSGRVVSVIVSDNGLELNNLIIKVERKIGPGDVKNGKIIQVTREEVKRRGAKRSTTFALSYESAEALQATLKVALKDARKRQFWHFFTNRMMFSVSELSR